MPEPYISQPQVVPVDLHRSHKAIIQHRLELISIMNDLTAFKLTPLFVNMSVWVLPHLTAWTISPMLLMNCNGRGELYISTESTHNNNWMIQERNSLRFAILTRLRIVAQQTVDAVGAPYIYYSIDNACTMRKTSGKWGRITYVNRKLKERS